MRHRVFRCLIVYAYNKTADCAESGSSSAPANPTQNVEYPEKGGELNHNLAKRHPSGAFSFLKTHIPCVFRVLLCILKENKKGSQRYKDILEATGSNMVPEWLDVDAENLKGSVKELPAREAIDVPVDEMLIVELYSK